MPHDAAQNFDPLIQEEVPLRKDAQGTIRIGESRVTLETLLEFFDRGSAPEELVRDFPSLELADVYAVIAHYLRNRRRVDAYRRRQTEKADRLRREIEQAPRQAKFRGRLLKRHQARDIA